MSKIASPCLDCEKRYLGCHGNCEEYKAFSRQKAADNDKRREVCSNRKLIEDFEYGIKEKMKKRYGRRK